MTPAAYEHLFCYDRSISSLRYCLVMLVYDTIFTGTEREVGALVFLIPGYDATDEEIWSESANCTLCILGTIMFLNPFTRTFEYGDFKKDPILDLHYPTNSTNYLDDGSAADPSSPCTMMLLATGFNATNSLWIEENFRQITLLKGTEKGYYFYKKLSKPI